METKEKIETIINQVEKLVNKNKSKALISSDPEIEREWAESGQNILDCLKLAIEASENGKTDDAKDRLYSAQRELAILRMNNSYNNIYKSVQKLKDSI